MNKIIEFRVSCGTCGESAIIGSQKKKLVVDGVRLWMERHECKEIKQTEGQKHEQG